MACSTDEFQKELKERLDFLSAKAEKLFLENEKNLTQGFYQGFFLFAFVLLMNMRFHHHIGRLGSDLFRAICFSIEDRKSKQNFHWKC